MATRRRLSNPPIREALVDLFVTGVEPGAVVSFWTLHDRISARYPHVEERKGVEATFRLDKAGAVAAAAQQVGLLGFFFKSADGNRVAQFRRDGFTANQIGGYTSADALFAEVLDLWPRYCALAQPHEISRLSMRYINELALPFRTGDDLTRFLAAGPNIPEELPQLVNQFQVNLDASGINQRRRPSK